MNTGLDDEYRQEVMLACKKLLDSLHEGRAMDLSRIVNPSRNEIQFVANIVKFGDTFKSDNTKPIYGILFTTEDQEEYLLKRADEIGLSEKALAKITIEMVTRKTDGEMD